MCNKLQLMRAFNDLSQKFLSREFVINDNNFCLGTVAELISIIRLYRRDLESEQVIKLLDIPLDILEHDVVLIDEQNYQTHADYFLGNLRICHNEFEFIQHFIDHIKSDELSLAHIVDYLKFIQKTSSLHQNDYLLRIPEVTIREDVKLIEYGNLPRSGRVFANLIDCVIGI